MTPEAPDTPEQAEPAPAAPPASALPEQSAEDTDAAWGDYDRQDSGDDRLLRDRPPHWADY